MKKCAICQTDHDDSFCPVCGFDASIDCITAPTLAPVSTKALMQIVRAARARINEELRCPVCGAIRHQPCSVCGYDDSCDYEELPTFALLKNQHPNSVKKHIKAAEHLKTMHCPNCGTDHFSVYFNSSYSGWQCVNCGMQISPAEVKSAQAAYCEARVRSLGNPDVHISAGDAHAVILRDDGTVQAVGNNSHGQCNTEDWRDIIAVSAGATHTVGLQADGTVVATGNNASGQCDVSNWTNIISVQAGVYHTAALRADGTVEVAGIEASPSYRRRFTDAVSVAAGNQYTVAITHDGNVLCSSENTARVSQLERWSDISQIAAGSSHVVGLTHSGQLMTQGNNKYGCRDITHWTDIYKIAAGRLMTVGLTYHGTVLCAGGPEEIQFRMRQELSRWTDIISVAVGNAFIMGLNSQGVVSFCGNAPYSSTLRVLT